MYERGFAAMERSHQRVMMEMRRSHTQELDALREEKEQALSDETRATQAGKYSKTCEKSPSMRDQPFMGDHPHWAAILFEIVKYVFIERPPCRKDHCLVSFSVVLNCKCACSSLEPHSYHRLVGEQKCDSCEVKPMLETSWSVATCIGLELFHLNFWGRGRVVKI